MLLRMVNLQRRTLPLWTSIIDILFGEGVKIPYLAERDGPKDCIIIRAHAHVGYIVPVF